MTIINRAGNLLWMVHDFGWKSADFSFKESEAFWGEGNAPIRSMRSGILLRGGQPSRRASGIFPGNAVGCAYYNKVL